MIGVNLIPARMHAARAGKRRLRVWGVTVALTLAVNTLPFLVNSWNVAKAGELREEHQSLSQQVSQAQKEVGSTAAEAATLLGRIERARALKTKRSWSAMFTMIGACLPEEAWLTSIATDPSAPSGAGRPRRLPGSGPDKESDEMQTVRIDAPEKLKIVGHAADHAQLYAFMANLKATGVFASVDLVRSGEELVADRNAVAFELTCRW
jgi:Tfp pilus assembly protein PilN